MNSVCQLLPAARLLQDRRSSMFEINGRMLAAACVLQP